MVHPINCDDILAVRLKATVRTSFCPKDVTYQSLSAYQIKKRNMKDIVVMPVISKLISFKGWLYYENNDSAKPSLIYMVI